MMPELSLNILDVAQNCVRAKAMLTEISICAETDRDRLTVEIRDNGCGMTPEQVAHVCDPFFTTRTTRKIGLGVPFFKEAAEDTGGSFSIESEPGKGTVVKAVFVLSSIDRMPLGDITFTIRSLITLNPTLDFVYRYQIDDRSFILDTRQFREILGDVPLNEPEVAQYIQAYLTENKSEVDEDVIL